MPFKRIARTSKGCPRKERNHGATIICVDSNVAAFAAAGARTAATAMVGRYAVCRAALAERRQQLASTLSVAHLVLRVGDDGHSQVARGRRAVELLAAVARAVCGYAHTVEGAPLHAMKLVGPREAAELPWR